MVKKSKKSERLCLCGSQKPAIECCEPVVEGSQLAKSAEQLMRSRYVAYAKGDEVYILNSWHQSTRPASLGDDFSANNAQMSWVGLEVLETTQVEDNQAFVEFKANFINQGRPGQMHERSRFFLEGGRWYYVDGEQFEVDSSGLKIILGRNDPCYCGSGKKYKKCCGAGK